MMLSEYLRPHGKKTVLAKAIGAQPQLVWQWANGVRPVPIDRCMAIERATAGEVTRRDLRPKDWSDIWPELAQVGDQIAAIKDKPLELVDRRVEDLPIDFKDRRNGAAVGT